MTTSAAFVIALAVLATAAGATAQDSDGPWYDPVRLGPSSVAIVQSNSRGARLLRMPGFRDITPRNIAGWLGDVEFLDHRAGWISANDCAMGRGSVMQTADGGSRWRRVTTRFSHSCAAGARSDLEFVDRDHGWIVTVEPTGPGSRLYRTRDGGRTWRQVGTRRGEVRQVEFTSPTTGWGVWAPPPGGPGPLYATVDAGRSWHAVERLPRGHYGVPVFHERHGVVAVAVRWAVLVYRTSNGARSWRLAGRLRFGGPLSGHDLSSPAPGVWWITTRSKRTRFLAVTSNGGRSWRRTEIDLPGRRQGFHLVATSARTALASPGGRLFRTRDAGRTWTPVRPP